MEDGNSNYEIFRDCVSATVLSKSSRGPTKKPKKRVPRGQGAPPDSTKSEIEVQSGVAGAEDDPSELAEFIEVCPKSRTCGLSLNLSLSSIWRLRPSHLFLPKSGTYRIT
jgi:hypothetical protein